MVFKNLRRLCLTVALVAAPGGVLAGELVYQPTIPAFGGNSNNFDYLVGLAQLQNQHVPAQSSSGGGAPDINFPPIVIDLGGVGGAPDVVDPSPSPSASSKAPYKFTIGQ